TVLNRILPLTKLGKLTIVYYTFPLEQIIKLLHFTSNLHTLKFGSISLNQNNIMLIEQSETFQYVSKINRIKNIDLRKSCTSECIKMIINLFSQLEYFKIGLNTKEI
ncbi:unnamed protein product, partial [Rotaria sp. Silwood2]